MKLSAVILLMILGTAAAQKVQTIAPSRSVIEGTAFQIQYVISNPSEVMSVYPPDFDSLQLISGPNHYKGVTIVEGKQQPIDNITYTVLAKKAGKYAIEGPDVTYKNFTHQRGQDVFITVVAAPKASYNTLSSYTDVNLYAPTKKVDYEKLIRDNLFVKTEVSKRTCYVGEPVVVTFTLYSRLQSSTEATKSPAFYGFSVADMIDINRSHPGVQTIDGKVFNTSILRKVQLYAVEKGTYSIDQMYLHNEIEFDDSLQKGEKITLNHDLETQPVSISVKTLRGKAPAFFTGGVGDFTIVSRLKKDSIEQHQEATLMVTISGKGNYLQFAQPVFDSIPGINIIDVSTVNKINNEVAPQEGSRTYMINFTADTVGDLMIPATYFSYYDINHNSYKTIHSDSLVCHVLPLAKLKVPVNGVKQLSNRLIWLVVLGIIIIVFAFAIQFMRMQWKPASKVEEVKVDYADALEPERLKEYTGKAAVLYIQKILQQVLNDKASLYSEKQRVKIKALIEKCELIIYTNVELTTPENLRKEAYETLKSNE